MTLRKLNWMAAACVAALSCSASVQAQDNGSAGVVRISDGRARTQVQPASFHGHQYGGYGNGYGNCLGSDCNGCYGCRPQCFNGWFQERYCKNSPDHGYSPPAKYPLHRRGVEYTQYFPNQWYGLPGANYQAAPMVYQPTDTTQLGYYYQHVPFWQPNASMMPQRPIPAQWHIVAPTVYASSWHQGYGGYGYGCPNCQMQGTSVNTDAMPAPATPTPAPAEVKPTTPEAFLPPAPRQFENSAASGHIRRAAYE